MRQPLQPEQVSVKEAVDFWMSLGYERSLRDTVCMWFELGESGRKFLPVRSRRVAQETRSS
jgi:hypothetical protein